MDQAHCRIPHSKDVQFDKPITQHLTGVLVHGKGLTIYRNYPNIVKSANLTIQCILLTLEQWKQDHGGNFPEEIYIQCDGGSENANQYVLAMLEFLVAKRLIKRIYMTRLPVGHTHEDIDACFGVIWNWFKSKSIATPQEYKVGLEEALKEGKLNAKVIDIYICPNYKKLLKPNIFEGLANLHKNEETQHQWRFEAVPVDATHFPLGVKTCYRALSNNQVVKITKLPKSQCVSNDGQLTGLEASTILVRWEPAVDLASNRAVEGTYLLTSMPSISADHQLSVAEFSDGYGEIFADAFSSISKKWDVSMDERKEWTAWFKKMPSGSQTAGEFIASTPTTLFLMKSPLKDYFAPDVFFRTVEDNFAGADELEDTLNKYTFEWPTQVAIANASVRTPNNLNPPLPYTFLATADNSNTLLSRYKEESSVYYSTILRKNRVTDLKHILCRRVNANGNSVSTSGLKDELVTRIYEWDIDIVRNLFRPISERDEEYIQGLFNCDPINEGDIIINILGFPVISKLTFKSLRSNQFISLLLIKIMIYLFQQRDKQLCEAHHEVNHSKASYRKRLPTLFVDLGLIDNIFDIRLESLTNDARAYFNLHKFSDYHQIIIPISNIQYGQMAQFEVCIFFRHSKIIHYINSKLPDNDNSVQESAIKRGCILRIMNEFLLAAGDPLQFENCVVYAPSKLYSSYNLPTPLPTFPIINEETSYDAGIYLLIIMEMLYYDLPLIFHENDIRAFRSKYAYAISKSTASFY